MSLSSNTQLKVTLTGTNSVTGDLSTRTEPIGITIAKTITNGTGSGQANRVVMDTLSVGAGGARTSVDLFDFGGVTDGIGQSLALSRIVAIIIENIGAEVADPNSTLTIGNHIGGGGFQTIFGETAELTLHLNGVHVFYSPAGYAVADSVNHLLDFVSQETSVRPIRFNLIVVGS
jgi:hypothetical protein